MMRHVNHLKQLKLKQHQAEGFYVMADLFIITFNEDKKDSRSCLNPLEEASVNEFFRFHTCQQRWSAVIHGVD